MRYKYRLFHTLSALSVSDTVFYYENMARKGWILTDSGYPFEKYLVGEPQDLYYSVVPKTPGLPVDIKNAGNWNYVAENRCYTIYSSKNKAEKIKEKAEVRIVLHE